MVIDEQNQNNGLLEESTFLEVWGAGSPVHPSFRPPRRLGRFAGEKRPKRRGGRKDGCTGDPATQTSRNVDSSRSLLF